MLRCMGCSGPSSPAKAKSNYLLLIQMNFIPGEGRAELPVIRETFSLCLLADALSLSLCPACIFQSAEFFEMLEKMQVSILNVGVGWGKSPVGVPQDTQDTTPGETHRQNSGPWREGREESTHGSDGLGQLRSCPRERHTGFWNGSCLKVGEKINRTCQQGRRMWGGFERVRRSWNGSERKPLLRGVISCLGGRAAK